MDQNFIHSPVGNPDGPPGKSNGFKVSGICGKCSAGAYCNIRNPSSGISHDTGSGRHNDIGNYCTAGSVDTGTCLQKGICKGSTGNINISIKGSPGSTSPGVDNQSPLGFHNRIQSFSCGGNIHDPAFFNGDFGGSSIVGKFEIVSVENRIIFQSSGSSGEGFPVNIPRKNGIFCKGNIDGGRRSGIEIFHNCTSGNTESPAVYLDAAYGSPTVYGNKTVINNSVFKTPAVRDYKVSSSHCQIFQETIGFASHIDSASGVDHGGNDCSGFDFHGSSLFKRDIADIPRSLINHSRGKVIFLILFQSDIHDSSCCNKIPAGIQCQVFQDPIPENAHSSAIFGCNISGSSSVTQIKSCCGTIDTDVIRNTGIYDHLPG